MMADDGIGFVGKIGTYLSYGLKIFKNVRGHGGEPLKNKNESSKGKWAGCPSQEKMKRKSSSIISRRP